MLIFGGGVFIIGGLVIVGGLSELYGIVRGGNVTISELIVQNYLQIVETSK